MTDLFPHPFADATLAPRVTTVLSVTAAAGAALLLARALASRRPDAPPHALLPATRDGYAYLVLALGTRFAVQHHRSRLQILVLLALVAAVEATRHRSGSVTGRRASWLAGSAAVCLGVVMAKWALEPGTLSDAVDRVRSGIEG